MLHDKLQHEKMIFFEKVGLAFTLWIGKQYHKFAKFFYIV